jgi:hypothetical protein
VEFYEAGKVSCALCHGVRERNQFPSVLLQSTSDDPAQARHSERPVNTARSLRGACAQTRSPGAQPADAVRNPSTRTGPISVV